MTVDLLGARRGFRMIVAVTALGLLLSGCAQGATGQNADASPSPTPTAACPEVEGVELPPECAPYDPDAAMAQNDRYRERIDLDEKTRAENTAFVEPVAEALDGLRTSGAVTADGVTGALEDAGLENPQVRGADGHFLFGVSGPAGGCVFGEVSTDILSVEVGGVIMDGGCLPAQ